MSCIFLAGVGFLGCAKPATHPAPTQNPAASAPSAGAANEAPDPEAAPAFTYPSATRGDTVDDYHGVKVPDPYRWLEAIDSPATQSWVDAQIQTTSQYLQTVPERATIRNMLAATMNYERFSIPLQKGDRLFVFRNDGLQDQDVLYWQKGLDGDMNLLLDPNKMSSDGTVALAGVQVSDDGKYLAYGVSESGSDWQTWHVMDIASGKKLEDKVEWIKFSNTSWSPDSKGFYYARFDQPAEGQKFSGANYFQKLYFHKLGTPQSEDRLVYERKDKKEWGFSPKVTEDGRYLVINVTKGTDRRNLIFLQDLKSRKNKTIELVPEFEATFRYLGNRGKKFYFHTNESAPRGRIVEIDIRRPDRKKWKELVPQGPDAMQSVSFAGGNFFVSYMHDAYSVVKVYDRRGKAKNDIALPGIGSASGFGGKTKAREVFYRFSSFTDPGSVYRYDIKKGQSSVFKRPKTSFNPADFVTRQVFYRSKDGTKVPMFITHRKDLKVNGNLPTYLYGYGGFRIPVLPRFSAANLVWMQMGGVYAQANLRGGGEYGQEWHEAGMKTNKQNVFDDFIAAAQWLIDSGYTQKQRLAIGGRSNGGLLVGATLTQRPDLFSAALPGVGVLDMLRFTEFTIGRAWTSDYGSPEVEAEFRALHAYSPYHNTVPGTKYPATLVYTADHDDRVYPAHSFKFAAALQYAQAGDDPVMIRIEKKAGHGAGMPTSKLIEQWADLWGFLVKNLDMKINAPG